MWAIYALLSAFFAATGDPIAKKALGRSVDEYTIGWLTLLISTPFLAAVYFSHRVEPLNYGLLWTLASVVPFEFAAAILYFKALKLTDISLSVPFLAITPIFVAITAFFMLGERLPPAGVFGIILITIGAYSLNIDKAKYGLFHPIKAIFTNKGSLYVVIVALIYGLTSTLSKKAMLYSSPASIPFIYNLSISLFMTPFVLYRLKTGSSKIILDRQSIIYYISLGLLVALSSIFYFKSVSLVSVAYTISIKRLSLLMSVGYGWLFFRERDIHIRIFSTFCMFLGTVLIVIS